MLADLVSPSEDSYSFTMRPIGQLTRGSVSPWMRTTAPTAGSSDSGTNTSLSQLVIALSQLVIALSQLVIATLSEQC